MITSIKPDVDTLVCPNCKAIWRAKWSLDYGDDIWTYDDPNAEYCPCGCRNWIGFKVKGNRINES